MIHNVVILCPFAPLPSLPTRRFAAPATASLVARPLRLTVPSLCVTSIRRHPSCVAHPYEVPFTVPLRSCQHHWLWLESWAWVAQKKKAKGPIALIGTTLWMGNSDSNRFVSYVKKKRFLLTRQKIAYTHVRAALIFTTLNVS